MFRSSLFWMFHRTPNQDLELSDLIDITSNYDGLRDGLRRLGFLVCVSNQFHTERMPIRHICFWESMRPHINYLRNTEKQSARKT